jgi:hypothetical protein
MRHFLNWLGPRLRLLFLTRYSVLTGLFPALFVLLALVVNPELLRGLLNLDTPAQLLNVTWLSVLLATLVAVMSRVTQVNAPQRFPDYQNAGGESPPPTPWRWRWLLLVLVGLPIPVACATVIQADPSEHWVDWGAWAFATPVWLLALGSVLLGLFVAFLILLLFTAAQQLLLHPRVRSQYLLPFEHWRLFRPLKDCRFTWLYPLGDRCARWAERLGPGYTESPLDENTQQPVPHPQEPAKPLRVFAPGHAQLLLWFGFTLLAYAVGALLSYRMGWMFEEPSRFPALFYLLLTVLLVGSLLGGLAFLLDYYRVPVLLTLALLALVTATAFRTDHYYQLNPDDRPLAAAPDLTFQQAIDRHDFPPVEPQTEPREKKRTLVVVTAAGGGIQAAAWTTQVLAGLDELYGPEFTRSIGLISAVSGGSVGTMHYLVNGHWDKDKGEPFTPGDREHMRRMSRRSGLEATGWGVAFPDLMHTFAPFVVPRYMDRGWALEEAWRRQIGTDGHPSPSDLRLGDWIEPTRRGEMPVVVFNATLAETGERLLISPALGPQSPPDDPSQAQDFFTLYQKDKPNPRVVTAVRLSATFPYVSPMSRPHRAGGARPEDSKQYHVADGGYADNEGALTVLEWLARLLDAYSHPEDPQAPGRPFDRILVIRIQPFPPAKGRGADTRHGWLYEALGPITTIQNVRVASQAERNSFAFRQLVRHREDASRPGADGARARRDNAQVQAGRLNTRAARVSRSFARDPDGIQSAEYEKDVGNLRRQGQESEHKAAVVGRELVPLAEVTWTTFVFNQDDAPLSWKLTQGQQGAIDAAWRDICAGKSVAVPNGLDEPPLATVDRFFHRRKEGADKP